MYRMWFVRLLPVVGLCVTGWWGGCKQGSVDTDVLRRPDGAEDFNDFYMKFHADSLFQVSRVVFPVSSEVGGDTVGGDGGRYYTANAWRMNRLPNFADATIQRDVTDLGSVLIERIGVSGLYYLERRFMLDARNRWLLIYYSGMKEIPRSTVDTTRKGITIRVD